jgi:WD40 repeat protein
LFNYAVWGALNKTIYVATTHGRVMVFDVATANFLKEKHLHSEEIFQLFMSHDFTMLVTSSRDGTSKLINPETLEEIRVFKYGNKPCRSAAISPLFDDREHQKFHIAVCGGQEARDVALMNVEGSGFEIKLFSVIYE